MHYLYQWVIRDFHGKCRHVYIIYNIYMLSTSTVTWGKRSTRTQRTLTGCTFDSTTWCQRTFDRKLLHYTMWHRHNKVQALSLAIMQILYTWELLTPETKCQLPGTGLPLVQTCTLVVMAWSPEIRNLIKVNYRQQSHDPSHLLRQIEALFVISSLRLSSPPSLFSLSNLQLPQYTIGTIHKVVYTLSFET